MKIRELFEDRVVASLKPDDLVLTAVRQMVEHKVGSMLIGDEEDPMRGIFTERDLMVRVVAKGLDPGSVQLGDVMTTGLYTTPADRTVTEVRHEMRERHIRHVPVVEGDRVLAVLSIRDLNGADLRERRRAVRDMTAYIRGDSEFH